MSAGIMGAGGAAASKQRLGFPFYSIVFALYPVLSFLGQYPGMESIQEGQVLSLVSFAGCAGIFLAFWWLYRSSHKAALAAFLLEVLFFSYGYIYGRVESLLMFGYPIGRHIIYAALWLAVGVLIAWAIKRRKDISPNIALILNVTITFLLAMSIIQAFSRQSQRGAADAVRLASTPVLMGASLESDPHTPDVYYIILDGYSREDTLEQVFHYDNSPFLDQLRELGFVTPSCAQSNYPRTALSLSSTLHMNYIDEFNPLLEKGNIVLDYGIYHDLLNHNPVTDNFERFGYQTIAFGTDFWWADVTDANVFLTYNRGLTEMRRYLSGYEEAFLRTTFLRVPMDANSIPNAAETYERQQYDEVRYKLSELERLPGLPGKKFVYAHIVSPHDPYVFGPDGEYQISAGGYVEQIEYLNQRMIQIVKKILAESPAPPVIIIQGDHGWDDANRAPILNAYYLPDGGSRNLYPSITPVNTFRLIFDTYFGGNYGLVQDESFNITGDPSDPLESVPFTCMNESEEKAHDPLK